MKSKNILVTGPPRCGKSTLIEKVVCRIQKPMTGFFTREDVLLVHVSEKNRDELVNIFFTTEALRTRR